MVKRHLHIPGPGKTGRPRSRGPPSRRQSTFGTQPAAGTPHLPPSPDHPRHSFPPQSPAVEESGSRSSGNSSRSSGSSSSNCAPTLRANRTKTRAGKKVKSVGTGTHPLTSALASRQPKSRWCSRWSGIADQWGHACTRRTPPRRYDEGGGGRGHGGAAAGGRAGGRHPAQCMHTHNPKKTRRVAATGARRQRWTTQRGHARPSGPSNPPPPAYVRAPSAARDHLRRTDCSGQGLCTRRSKQHINRAESVSTLGIATQPPRLPPPRQHPLLPVLAAHHSTCASHDMDPTLPTKPKPSLPPLPPQPTCPAPSSIATHSIQQLPSPLPSLPFPPLHPGANDGKR